jgi:hypothetical protein
MEDENRPNRQLEKKAKLANERRTRKDINPLQRREGEKGPQV